MSAMHHPVRMPRTQQAVTGSFKPATLERDADGWEHYATVCTLRFDGRSMEAPWRMGTAHNPNRVSVRDVLHALTMDARSTQEPFDEWCADCGYDVDSRKAEATYEACKQLAAQLLHLMGAQHAELLRLVDSWDL